MQFNAYGLVKHNNAHWRLSERVNEWMYESIQSGVSSSDTFQWKVMKKEEMKNKKKVNSKCFVCINVCVCYVDLRDQYVN